MLLDSNAFAVLSRPAHLIEQCSSYQNYYRRKTLNMLRLNSPCHMPNGESISARGKLTAEELCSLANGKFLR
jgi:hypothetical protein